MTAKKRRRTGIYVFLFLLLLGTEIVIGIYGLGFVRYYIGDLLVLPLLYCLIRIFTDVLPRTLPLWLFGVGCAAELLQLCRLSERLGFAPGSLPAILIGTSASWMDVLFYALGTVLLYGVLLLARQTGRLSGKRKRLVSVMCLLLLTIGAGAWWVQMALTYRFDYDPDWMLGKSLKAVEKRYIRYNAQAAHSEALEAQGYCFVAQDCYFHDVLSSAGSFYYLYYVKCDADGIVTDVQIVDTGIGG